MILVETTSTLHEIIETFGKDASVGFVPTMGALHIGHISLVERCVSENAVTVVSIFVNPTQFIDPADLERYPRTLQADLALLEKTGCQIVFAPKVAEIYPEPDTRLFDFGPIETVMEGKHRPGHFNGVAQVVSKLFDAVKPNRAYFGLKDFQQLAIIKEMTRQLELPVDIVSCPIVREESGLAMSSRNELLTADQRQNAVLISKTLFEAKNLTNQKSVSELAEWVISTINNNSHLIVEYCEIVDDTSLQPTTKWDEPGNKIACVAVFCGKIRLIDNIVLN